MSLQLMQDFVNKKDWDGLANDQDVNFFWFLSSYQAQDLKVDKDFFFDMVLNEQRMQISKNLAESAELSFNDSAIGRRINKIIIENNLKFTSQEWTKFLMTFKKMVESNFFGREAQKRILSFLDKDVNYFKALTTNLELFRYVYSGFKRYTFSLYLPKANEINELPQSDKDFFIENVSVYYSMMEIYPRENEEHVFNKFFKTPKEAMVYLWEDRTKSDASKFRSFAFGRVLSDLSTSEYEKIVNFLFEEYPTETTKYKINELMVYFGANRFDPDKKISDELLEKLVNFVRKDVEYYGELKEFHFNDIFNYGIHGMTKEQMEKYAHIISSRWLIKSETVDLKEAKAIKESAGLELNVENSSGKRFFTEEEIRENPEFFDPRHLKQYPLYCSKETFKVLNSHFGLRQRWDEKLVDFVYIVGKMIQREDLNMKTLKYLMKKTKASATDVIEAIDKSYWQERIKDKNILIFKNFYKKYKI